MFLILKNFYLTPLHSAASEDACEIVEILLKQPKIDTKIKDMVSNLFFKLFMIFLVKYFYTEFNDFLFQITLHFNLQRVKKSKSFSRSIRNNIKK